MKFDFHQLRRTILLVVVLIAFCRTGSGISAQNGGTIRGTVGLKVRDLVLVNATVRISQLGRVASTKADGSFEFTDIPPGIYTVVASMPAMNGASESVTVQAGATATVIFKLELAPIHSDITVSASGREQLTMEAFQTVTSLDALELAKAPSTSLGEALDRQPGVAKRSFGPGSSRPVIRGFDGDRVLVMQDGAPVGGLGYQSGDHAEPINTTTLERLEVLKGPATLLYGSSAIGGVVNAITSESFGNEGSRDGMRGFFTGIAGSNNSQAGGSASFSYGANGWRIFGDGGGQRAGNYSARRVEIENTQSRVNNGQVGFGRDMDRSFFSVSSGYDKGLYGIVGEDTSIDFRRYNSRFNGGFQNMTGPFKAFRSTVAYTDWKHAEIEDGVAATTLNNRQLTYRGVFEQQRSGGISGSFGFSGVFRHYEAAGEESLAPPTAQKSIAAFLLEEASHGRAKLQWGGRFDHVGYAPDGGVQRGFNGLSAGAGVHFDLWRSGAFVANYTNSYRAPALEELYNNGPHPGNLAFEIGHDDLERERSNGLDLSLRHQDSHVHAQANFFYYDIDNFVYLAPTTDMEDGLRVFDYAQDAARFIGAEAVLDVAVHPNVWVDLRFDSVNAKLKTSDTPLPRIPPLRGEVGLDIRYQSLSVHPEMVMGNAQSKTFTFETRTPGYTVFNLKASYTLVQTHAIHVIAANAFNLGDRVYLNHVSFVKDQGPEIGRGLSVSYSVRYF